MAAKQWIRTYDDVRPDSNTYDVEGGAVANLMKRMSPRVDDIPMHFMSPLAAINANYIDRLSNIVQEYGIHEADELQGIRLMPEIRASASALESDRFFKYPKGRKKIVDLEVRGQVVKAYKKYAGKNRDYTAKIAKMKNTGCYAFVSGSEPSRNLSVNIASAELTMKAVKKVDLQYIIQHMSNRTGLPFCSISGVRYSDSNKLIAYYYKNSFKYNTDLVFPRSRQIVFSSKLKFYNNKEIVSKVQKDIFAAPWHCVDQNYVSKIDRELRIVRGFFCVCFDYEKFEFQQNEFVTPYIYQVIADTWRDAYPGIDDWMDRSNYLDSITKIYSTYKNEVVYPLGVYRNDSGGEATTTKNQIAAALFLYEALTEIEKKLSLPAGSLLLHNQDIEAEGEIKSRQPKIGKNVSFYAHMHGDDIILWGDPKVFKKQEDFEELFQSAYKKNDLVVTKEPRLKYLGWVYEGKVGYSLGRMIMKRISPERMKNKELFNMGLVIAYDMLENGRDFFQEKVYPELYKILAKEGKPYFDEKKSSIERNKYELPTPKEFADPKHRMQIVKEGIEYANRVGVAKGELADIATSLVHRMASGSSMARQYVTMFGLSDDETGDMYELDGITVEKANAEAKTAANFDSYLKEIRREGSSAWKLADLYTKIFKQGTRDTHTLLEYLVSETQLTKHRYNLR